MRISEVALFGALALAGCQRAPEGPGAAASNAEQGHVLCALGGSAAFTPDCAMDRTAGPDGLTLTVRNPDGGFRKLTVTKDGRGVVAADGAEPARVTVTGDREIEVAVGRDRYRLPATVKGKPLRP